MLERTAEKPRLVGRDMSDEWRKPRHMSVPGETALQGLSHPDTDRYSRRSQTSVVIGHLSRTASGWGRC